MRSGGTYGTLTLRVCILGLSLALPATAQVILDLCCNKQREVAMPWFGGLLTTAAYLMPWLWQLLRPMLERRGARVKAKLKRHR